jgi:hypothetical protein
VAEVALVVDALKADAVDLAANVEKVHQEEISLTDQELLEMDHVKIDLKIVEKILVESGEGKVEVLNLIQNDVRLHRETNHSAMIHHEMIHTEETLLAMIHTVDEALMIVVQEEVFLTATRKVSNQETLKEMILHEIPHLAHLATVIDQQQIVQLVIALILIAHPAIVLAENPAVDSAAVNAKADLLADQTVNALTEIAAATELNTERRL